MPSDNDSINDLIDDKDEELDLFQDDSQAYDMSALVEAADEKSTTKLADAKNQSESSVIMDTCEPDLEKETALTEKVSGTVDIEEVTEQLMVKLQLNNKSKGIKKNTLIKKSKGGKKAHKADACQTVQHTFKCQLCDKTFLKA